MADPKAGESEAFVQYEKLKFTADIGLLIFILKFKGPSVRAKLLDYWLRWSRYKTRTLDSRIAYFSKNKVIDKLPNINDLRKPKYSLNTKFLHWLSHSCHMKANYIRNQIITWSLEIVNKEEYKEEGHSIHLKELSRILTSVSFSIFLGCLLNYCSSLLTLLITSLLLIIATFLFLKFNSS